MQKVRAKSSESIYADSEQIPSYINKVMACQSTEIHTHFARPKIDHWVQYHLHACITTIAMETSLYKFFYLV